MQKKLKKRLSNLVKIARLEYRLCVLNSGSYTETAHTGTLNSMVNIYCVMHTQSGECVASIVISSPGKNK